jgi:hypothetical protein
MMKHRPGQKPNKGGLSMQEEQTIEGGRQGLGGLYGLEIADRSMMPFFAPGDVLIFEKDSVDWIEDEDMVVCQTGNGLACIGRIYLISPEEIEFRPFDPAFPAQRFPRTHLVKCDRLVQVGLK